MTPAHTFRIHPDGRYYFIVRLWKTLAHLRRWYRRDTGRPGKRVVACCTASDTRSLHLGDVSLSLSRLDAGIVAHELAHATFRWCERLKIPLWEAKAKWTLQRRDPEERFTYALDRMVKEFWQQFYEEVGE